jgi:sn-glycerol 3-phosphate transport system permease protein
LFATVVLTIGAFQAYGQMDILTEGGPGDSTRTLVYSIYGKSSTIAGNPGLQAATAILLFAVLLVLSLVQFTALERRAHYVS